MPDPCHLRVHCTQPRHGRHYTAIVSFIHVRSYESRPKEVKNHRRVHFGICRHAQHVTLNSLHWTIRDTDGLGALNVQISASFPPPICDSSAKQNGTMAPCSASPPPMHARKTQLTQRMTRAYDTHGVSNTSYCGDLRPFTIQLSGRTLSNARL